PYIQSWSATHDGPPWCWHQMPCTPVLVRLLYQFCHRPTISLSGVSLCTHSPARAHPPSLTVLLCPFIGIEWEMVFQQMANQSSANAPCLRSASSFDTTRA